MPRKILAIALAQPDVYDAGETATLLARHIRMADPTIGSAELVSLPWLDGSRGTLDFLVTNTLGSFLEVEATSASGEEIVAPLGFAGEDGKLAVIEMSRIAQVEHAGKPGTTAGVGQLIQDALDEGAFSIVLCHEEPLAADAGFGAAAALGVRFFNAKGEPIDYLGTESGEKKLHPLSEVARVDTSGRSFALLSSRVFIARSEHAWQSEPSQELREQLTRLATIIQRDTGILPSTHSTPEHSLSASAIEFGLTAFLGAEVREGYDLVLEASQIEQAIIRDEYSHAIVLAPDMEALATLRFHQLLELVRNHIGLVTVITRKSAPKDDFEEADFFYSLEEVPLFQAPLGRTASLDEVRRNFTMRLEKLMPKVMEALKQGPRERKKAIRERRA